MFGGGARARRTGGARPRGPQRGQDVESTLEIPFRTAALGGKVPVELDLNEECATCHGSGAAPGAKLVTCEECKGRGTISFGQGGFAVQASMSRVPRPRSGADGALPDVRRRRRGAHAEEGA